jgi:hypothetical protein
MGIYSRAYAAANPKYRLKVCEASLRRIDAATDRIPNDALSEPVLEILNAIGWWREGLIDDRKT